MRTIRSNFDRKVGMEKNLDALSVWNEIISDIINQIH